VHGAEAGIFAGNYNNEGNEPMHIHVESDDKYAKFWLDHVQLAKSIGYSAKELNEIKKLVSDNIHIFKERWYEQFRR